MVNGSNIPIIGKDDSQIRIQHFQFPVASPSAAAIIDPDGEAALKIVGGFTKLEAAAIQIAAGLAASPRDGHPHPLVKDTITISLGGETTLNYVQLVALTAAQVAAAVLNACQQIEEHTRGMEAAKTR